MNRKVRKAMTMRQDDVWKMAVDGARSFSVSYFFDSIHGGAKTTLLSNVDQKRSTSLYP